MDARTPRRALRPRDLDPRQPRAVDPGQGPGPTARPGPLRPPRRTVPGPWSDDPGRPVPALAGPGRTGGDRAALPPVRLHLPRPGNAHEGGVARRRARVRHRLQRRIPPAPRPLPDAGRLVPRPGRRDRAPARGARPRDTPRPRRALAARPGTHVGDVVPGVRPVVRHRTDRRLAPPVQRHRRGLRPPPHPPYDLVRRGALRGGLHRLPQGVAREGTPARPAAADPPLRGRTRPAGPHRRRTVRTAAHPGGSS